jgi:hypothetical protein
MVRLVLAAVVICGCYAPQPPQGAPCDDDHPCPTGQSCIAGFCSFGGNGAIDAPGAKMDGPQPDGPPFDVDADGIANANDNCPMTSNADQGNEDGDPLGDKCDPCPIDPASPPSDPDNDGVSDSCDPRPATPGDSIVVFEGFHAGVPSTWQVIGTTTQSGDDIVMVGSAGNYNALIPPINAPVSGTVSMRGQITASVGTFDSAFAVTMPFDPGAVHGIFCELYAPNAGNATGRSLDIYDSIPDMVRGSKGFAWQLNTPYTLVGKRANTAYGCSNGTENVSGSTNSAPASNKAAVFTFGVNASISWMLVVSST